MDFPTFDTLEDVPEPFRPFYHLVDGKAVINLTLLDLPEDERATMQGAIDNERTLHGATKTQLTSARNQLATAQRKLRQQVAGVPDSTAGDAPAGTAPAANAATAQLLDEEVATRLAPVTEERDTLRETNATLAAENKKFKLHDRVKAVMKAVRILEDREDAVMELLVPKRIDLNDNGTMVIKDKNGVVLSVTLEKFFERGGRYFFAESEWAYDATAVTGTGTRESRTTTTSSTGTRTQQGNNDVNRQVLSGML